MRLKVFSLRDSKGEVFNSPFYKHNERDAEYDVRRLVNDKQSLPSQYPKDFDLYVLGEFDDQTGKFALLDKPQHIAECINMVDQTNQSSELKNTRETMVSSH